MLVRVQGAAAVCACLWYRVHISLGPCDVFKRVVKRECKKARQLECNDPNAIWGLCRCCSHFQFCSSPRKMAWRQVPVRFSSRGPGVQVPIG